MQHAVDNFEKIRNLLTWENPGEYYYIQLILRKKDKTTSYGNKNNSARLIKDYCFYNIDQFNEKEQEIKALCEFRKCRAGISLNKRSNRKTAILLLKYLSERFESNNFDGINHLLQRANGKPAVSDKIWLIDIDDPSHLPLITEFVDTVKPIDRKKIIEIVETYTGLHLITTKFDKKSVRKLCEQAGIPLELHENNPVALYYPSKSEEDES